MPLRKLKPVTPGQRHTILQDFSDITKKEPEKSLVFGLKKTGGRNNTGRITVRHRGGGHKRLYRIIDFKGRIGYEAIVKSIEYDPNRNARIALITYTDGVKSYIIAPLGLKVGDRIKCGEDAEIKVGNRLPLKNIPEGTQIYNIELIPGKGGQIARSAGTFATLMVKGEKYAQVRLPSGEIRLFDLRCYASIGQVSNPEYKYISLGKAGRSRWLGIRPTVRGVAMNPVDHPMGGGEGKGKGHQSQSPTGVPAKGYKTRKKRKPSDKFIVQRRGKK
ncbi:MAG: 50S ribosomal protein L2 [candidate division WOR-3 bacterium]|nr:50S ribosomal protein L2 [Candidatus Omnitrophota bacterium]MCM8807271.1 50S ribosomal protein L2 [Candidatus Omnitrophota bacterium]